jgi:hypothetical protein
MVTCIFAQIELTRLDEVADASTLAAFSLISTSPLSSSSHGSADFYATAAAASCAASTLLASGALPVRALASFKQRSFPHASPAALALSAGRRLGALLTRERRLFFLDLDADEEEAEEIDGEAEAEGDAEVQAEAHSESFNMALDLDDSRQSGGSRMMNGSGARSVTPSSRRSGSALGGSGGGIGSSIVSGSRAGSPSNTSWAARDQRASPAARSSSFEGDKENLSFSNV